MTKDAKQPSPKESDAGESVAIDESDGNVQDSQQTNDRPAAQEANAPESGWTFTGNSPQVDRKGESFRPRPADPNVQVHWTASEFIHHQKSFAWYLVLAVSALAAGAIVYLLTRGDKITAAVIPVAALFFGISAARKPRTLDYEVNGAGIIIGRHFYPYANMKSFSIVHQGAFSSVSFMPLKRFMPFLTMYYAPEDEEKIVGVLSSYLPVEMARRDMLDQFLERIRF
ncbi:MAG TPA: hypothetical protein VLG11_06270 [Candidatus Saccharimonadales bacterium]|nr:hypothetical protein [Candidatus Saccharimonadales bacterium]